MNMSDPLLPEAKGSNRKLSWDEAYDYFQHGVDFKIWFPAGQSITFYSQDMTLWNEKHTRNLPDWYSSFCYSGCPSSDSDAVIAVWDWDSPVVLGVDDLIAAILEMKQ